MKPKKIDAKIESIETIIEATPKEGMSLDELKTIIEHLGNPILEVNYDDNYIKMIHCINKGES